MQAYWGDNPKMPLLEERIFHIIIENMNKRRLKT